MGQSVNLLKQDGNASLKTLKVPLASSSETKVVVVDNSGNFSYNPSISSGGAGTVTTLSIISANGLAGTVANPTTTPAITLTTSITGLLKGNGTSISAAVAGVDYLNAASVSSLNDATASLYFTTASLNNFSASILSYTASNNIAFGNATSSLYAATASINLFTASILSYTASNNTVFGNTTSSLYAFTASINSYTSSLNAKTGSFAITGSNYFSGNQTISGSLTITGSITVSENVINTLTASYAVTASYALNVGNIDTGSLVTTSSFNAYTASLNAFSSSINTATASFSLKVGGLEAATASLNNFSASIFSYTSSNNANITSLNATTASIFSYTSSLNNKTGSFATTGSNIFTADQTIQGNLTVNRIIVQTITASQTYSSGSNVFGNSPSNTQVFTGSMYVAGAISGSSFSGAGTNLIGTATSLNIGGNAATVTTNANLTGMVTSVGNATTVVTNANLTGNVTSVGNATTIASGVVTSDMIADGTIVNGDINASAAIVDTKLATISTGGKVSNSATTATSANTVSAIVARDASGNFSAGTITADLSGTASNVTTNANLTGVVTSVGNATSIANGAITNAMLANSAVANLTGTNSGDQTNITGYSTAVVATVTGTNSTELVRGNMADNDQFRILVGGTATNAGYAEIATADDGTEPIYVRQYTGVFSTLTRTATLLDGSGNTSFPGTIGASNFSGTHSGTSSGTNTGDQTNISGTAGSETLATVTGRGATTNTAVIINNNLAVNTNSPYDTSQFSLDVNGGLLIKNTSKTATLTLINANPATAVNAGFVQWTAGGTTTGAFAALQTYYGASIVGGTLRLQPNGARVGIGVTSASYALDVSGSIRATDDIIAYSDSRVKENVNTITDALTKVISLRGVTYTRIDSKDKSRKIGVIAQEVLPILPEVVQQDDNGNYSVAYGNMVGVLIEAIKEQQQQINELKALLQNK